MKVKEYLNINETVAMFEYVCKIVILSEPMLTGIDKKIGDGDHGFGMRKGFTYLGNLLKKERFSSINDLFKFVGISLLKSMGGASGVIFGTIFIGGLKESKITDKLSTEFLADFFSNSMLDVQRRGMAQLGDKTILDALSPAVDALKKCAIERKCIKESIQIASEYAGEGVEKTKDMIAKFGRAKQYKEMSLGYPDPGASSFYIILKSMSEWLNKRDSTF